VEHRLVIKADFSTAEIKMSIQNKNVALGNAGLAKYTGANGKAQGKLTWAMSETSFEAMARLMS
jgi:photosystem II stability/assembly factor-like uncharacterized protein